MSVRSYEDMDVYKLAMALAVEVHPLTLAFPKHEQFGGAAGQLRRCTTSICANLGEGLSKRMSAADKRKFVQISLGSTEECRVWLQLAAHFGYVSPQQAHDLRARYTRVSQMLYRLQSRVQD